MSHESFIITIVAIIAFAVIKIARIKHGTDLRSRIERRFGGHALPDPAQPTPRELELEREVEALHDRVRVLERIATDGRRTQLLADEIEGLRDR